MAARGPAPCRIRPAVAADLPALQTLAEAAYERYVAAIGRRPAPMDADFAAHIARGEAWAAALDPTDATTLAGYVVLLRDKSADALFLENIAVAPSLQGRGIGRALLDWSETTARDLGRSAIELYTNAQMTENLALYPHLGYVETDRRREDGFDRVFFRKTLPPKAPSP